MSAHHLTFGQDMTTVVSSSDVHVTLLRDKLHGALDLRGDQL